MKGVIQLLAVSFLFVVVESFEPARLENGEVFIQPPMTAGGGEVLLELDVTASGGVRSVTVLRTTPPFGDLLRQTASGWRFEPAREVQEDPDSPVAVDSKVLVAGFFRPPTLYNAPARGEIPKDVARPSDETPFPTSMAAPLYPPTAYVHMSQMVGIEVEIGVKGEITSSKVIRPAETRDLSAAALEASKEWRFQPARRNGKAVPAVAYIVFGFREPVASGE
jgi:TonB family protein